MCINCKHQIEKARRQLNQIHILLDDIDTVNSLKEADRYRELCAEAVMIGEKLTCDLRKFALTFSDETIPSLMEHSVETLGIAVRKKMK